MSSTQQEPVNQALKLSTEATSPYPGSSKIYIEGSRPDIRVPMRQVSQDDTSSIFGAEENPPITLYDTSGLYTRLRISIEAGGII
jgi:phosphomethylpyrimidine synthase